MVAGYSHVHFLSFYYLFSLWVCCHYNVEWFFCMCSRSRLNVLRWQWNSLTLLYISWFYSFSPKRRSVLSMEWTLFWTPSGRSGRICWMWWALTVSFKCIMTLLTKERWAIKRGTYCESCKIYTNNIKLKQSTFSSLSSFCSLKPQPLLQPHISHQLPGTRPAPGRRCTLGLLVPLHVPGGFLLPAARCVRPLLLARARHALRPVLPLHPAEVRGRPWARGAAPVLHHGGVLHDRACGSVLASGRRGRFTGRENRPPGHSDQAA